VRIADIKLFRICGQIELKWSGHEERIARPLDRYPEFRDEGPSGERRRRGGTETVRQIFVEILTDDGPAGLYGPLMGKQAAIIGERLKPFLIGRDPLAGELLWDQMSLIDRHGRTGYMTMAISAIDNALWDLKGKLFGVPVYRLLGGPTREALRPYASMLGFSLEPEAVRERVTQFQEMGFTAQKWFFRHGPSAGREGMQKNLTLVRTLREAVGEGYDLMFDCFQSWDVPYAVAMAREMLAYRPTWLEEPLPANDLDGFVRIRQATGIPLATGEHLDTRWGVKPYLEAGILDFLQTDPEWTGGITELVKICAMAAVYGVKVVPHGHHIAAAAHVVASQPPALCPMVEYLIEHKERQQALLKNPLIPVNGMIPLPTAPGLIELDEAKYDEREELD
jgi:L-alanine-DL-glutamate epimerase-like enolase superfamily enzyme